MKAKEGLQERPVGDPNNNPTLAQNPNADNPKSFFSSRVTSEVRKILEAAQIDSHRTTLVLQRLENQPCPPPGGGINPVWLPSTCGYLVHRAGLAPEVVKEVVESSMSRPPRVGEIERCLGLVKTPFTRPQCVRTRSQFEPEILEQFIRGCPSRTFSEWRKWLWERSTSDPDRIDALDFCEALYAPGDYVAIVRNRQSDPRPCLVGCGLGTDRQFLSTVTHDGHEGGVWFMIQPVDGEKHHNPRNGGKLSYRSEEAVTRYRYMLLESDNVRTEKWLAVLSLLKARIAAIYTSGKRSIHALVRVDESTKEGWDKYVGPLKGPLTRLGADPGALTAVRLSRLPGCWRRECAGFQKLLYICRDPSDIPLANLPVLSRRSEWAAELRTTRTRKPFTPR